jgi:hypothetical protein
MNHSFPSTTVYVVCFCPPPRFDCAIRPAPRGNSIPPLGAMTTRSQFAFVPMLTIVACAACSERQAEPATSTSPILGAATATNAVTGTVSGETGTCPAITFLLERKTIRTDASTTFRETSCGAIRNTARVEVTGTATADGSIPASLVRLLTGATGVPTTPAPTPVPSTVVSGSVTFVGGTCPALKFAIGERTVLTTVVTTFSGKGCGDLKVGSSVEAAGALSSANILAAIKITQK